METRKFSNLSQYLDDLSLELEDLQDKQILELGSGYGMFQKECEASLSCNVFAVDINPQYKHERVVAADAAGLPFSDNTFDIIISRDSVPWMNKGEESIRQILREAVRVLSGGGEARFVPLGKRDRNTFALVDRNPDEVAHEYELNRIATDELMRMVNAKVIRVEYKRVARYMPSYGIEVEDPLVIVHKR